VPHEKEITISLWHTPFGNSRPYIIIKRKSPDDDDDDHEDDDDGDEDVDEDGHGE